MKQKCNIIIMDLIKTQTIHVSSTGDTPARYYISLPREATVCEDDELLSISLQSFQCYFDTHLVNSSNNSFSINGVAIVLEAGNYSFKQLYQTINRLYGISIASYNKQRSSLVFQAAAPIVLNTGNAFETLGFPQGTHTGTYLEGSVLDPMKRLANIVVHLDGLSPYRCFHFDTIGGYADPSSILHVVSFDAAPFSWFSYSPTQETPVYVNDKSIQILRLRFTDLDGQQLDGLLPHHSLSIRINTHKIVDEDESLATLKQIANLTRLQLLTKHVKKR